MDAIKLTPYAKMFDVEWLLHPESYRYNITIDQLLYGSVDFEKLRHALKAYVSEHVVLNGHIENKKGEASWVKNNRIYLTVSTC